MKAVFIGTVDFSLSCLKVLVETDIEIVGVLTKEKSNFNSDYADLAPFCNKYSIPVKHFTNVNNPDILDWVKSLNPEIIFCFGLSSLIKKELLSSTELGVVGFHPAMLPANRGRHPIIWALALGLKETGSTFFFMGEGADDGPILDQEKVSISETDDAYTLYEKIKATAREQIKRFSKKLLDGSYDRIEQDHSLSNNWRKRDAIDGQIDFRMSSRAIYNLVRALTKPYVGAHIEHNGEFYSVWQVKVVNFDIQNIEPGKILDVNGTKVLIKTMDGAIELLDHELPEMKKGEYL